MWKLLSLLRIRRTLGNSLILGTGEHLNTHMQIRRWHEGLIGRAADWLVPGVRWTGHRANGMLLRWLVCSFKYRLRGRVWLSAVIMVEARSLNFRVTVAVHHSAGAEIKRPVLQWSTCTHGGTLLQSSPPHRSSPARSSLTSVAFD